MSIAGSALSVLIRRISSASQRPMLGRPVF